MEEVGSDTREHTWMQIGTHDVEGFRTHTTPGDVCMQCSDATRWVPVSQCKSALKAWEAEHGS